MTGYLRATETTAFSRWLALVLLLILAYALGVSEYWHFAYIYAPHIDELYRYQQELLHGHAEWVADQNRVLAPLVIAAFRTLFNTDYPVAYHHFMFYSFIGQNLCAAFLFWQCRLTLSQSLVGLFLVAATPALLMNYWWFPWTNLEAILAFLTFVVDASGSRLKVRAVLFGLIFVAWALTKETCVLLPIWIGLRYGFEALAERRWTQVWQLALVCGAMILLAAGVVSGLRHWLWVSGSNPARPTGNVSIAVGGTHLLFLLPETLRYYVRSYSALLTARIPWPLWKNPHFPDWPAGAIDILIASCIAVAGAVWSCWQRAWTLLALALLSMIYLFICFALVNMPEADKLMPLLATGAYAYALMNRRARQALSLTTTYGYRQTLAPDNVLHPV